jgi:hypothetical protein
VFEITELLEIIVGDTLELGPDDARFAPLAIVAKGNFADDRIEDVAMHVFGELALVEAAGRLHGLGENLAAGIAKGRIRVAERIASSIFLIGRVANLAVGPFADSGSSLATSPRLSGISKSARLSATGSIRTMASPGHRPTLMTMLGCSSSRRLSALTAISSNATGKSLPKDAAR